MILMAENTKIALRDNILSLAVNCPVWRANPEDCPLYAIRRLELPQRLQWFNGLSNDDLIYLNAYHCLCAQLRMQARLEASEALCA